MIPHELTRCTGRILRLRIGAGPAQGESYLPGDRVWPTDTEAAPSLAAVAEHYELRSPAGEAVLRMTLPEPQGGRLRLGFSVVGEQHFYGLGLGGLPFDRLGGTRRLWNCHVNHGGGSDIAIPLLLSRRGYGLFFDTTVPALLDPGPSMDEIAFDYSADTDGLDLYLLWGDDLRGLMGPVADLLGRAPLPPRWSLGYLQSSRHADSLAEFAALGAEFRARNLPCDGLILLSTYGDARGWNRGVGHLEPLDPEFPAFVASLHAIGMRVVTHEYPVLHHASPLHAEAAGNGYLLAEAYPDVPPAGRGPATYHDGQRYLDFARAEVGAWWWDRHRALHAAGIDGWWLDGGEGPQLPASTHNRYDLARQAAFAAGEARDRPARRPFLLCRSGGAGMQHHGAVPWSGDTNNSFATLEGQIATGLNLGLSGVPFWGTDIGGYYPTLPEDAELFIRWFQFGAFTPLFRAHGRNWRMRLPWSYGTETEAIIRRYLDLRYRLMPYTYTLAWQAHRFGLPLMRPLVLHDPDDPQLWDMASAYLWGDDLLVAPVTRAGATRWPVYLPRGEWHDFWTGERHGGGRAVEVAAPLDRLPLFVRAGVIIPMAPPQAHALPVGPQELTLRVHPAGRSAFELYEDDGETRAWQRGAGVTTRFTCDATDAGLTFRIDAPSGDLSLLPPHRRYTLAVHAPRPPRAVRLHTGGTPGWQHDGDHTLHVAVPSHPAEVSIEW